MPDIQQVAVVQTNNRLPLNELSQVADIPYKGLFIVFVKYIKIYFLINANEKGEYL